MMLYKIIFKNFKSNLKNYILFFISNTIAVAEMFAFWGINDIVKDAVTDEIIAFALKYDFRIAAGLVSFITVFLMVFAMRHYVNLRIKDYSTFVMLGMKKKMSYFMILTEYSIGWLFSFLIGLIIGNGVLYGAQMGMHYIYPSFVKITRVDFSIYRNTFCVSLGIMVIVFVVILIWMDGKDLSTLMLDEEVKEKKPVSKRWLILALLGMGIIAVAAYHYPAGDMQYLLSHMEWVVGGFFVLAFGGGVVLGGLEKWKSFYLRHMLQLNQLSSKYQSSLFIILILFVVHFFALTYISVEIASALPLEKYRENYPYDMVWMAQPKDKEFSEELVRKYGGEVDDIPMIRVTTFYGAEQIGIAQSDYKKLSGKECHLTGREILVGVEDQEYQKEKKIRSEDDWRVYTWLYLGKKSARTEEFLADVLEEEEYLYDIKDIHTQNVIGQYSTDQYHENVIVFSDDYFKESWKQISENTEEPSVLKLFTFPSANRAKAWKELKAYADENGVKEFQGSTSQNALYGTEQFLIGEKMRQLFKLASKLFILVSLFISAFFVMGIKTLSELTSYEKRYEFLNCMGMKKRMREKTLRFEIQSIANIALGAGLCMAIIYARAFVIRSERYGTNVTMTFWKYWLALIAGYILIEYFMHRLFARYVICRLRKGNDR